MYVFYFCGKETCPAKGSFYLCSHNTPLEQCLFFPFNAYEPFPFNHSICTRFYHAGLKYVLPFILEASSWFYHTLSWVQTFACLGTRKNTPVNSQRYSMLLGTWTERLWAPKEINTGFPPETSLVLNQDHKSAIGRLMTTRRKKLHWWAQKAPRYITHKTDFPPNLQ